MKTNDYIKQNIKPRDWHLIKQFVNKQFPWTKYVIFVEQFGPLTSIEIRNWCALNLIGKF